MDNETMKLIYEGKDLLFTFKSEAVEFALRNKLILNYQDFDLIDTEHYEVVGYKSKIYWIVP